MTSFDWGGAYDDNGTPDPASGNHRSGDDCLSCHENGSTQRPEFIFAGTVYEADGTTPAANVEVGVFAGGQMYTAYSAANGNFWVEGDNNTITGPEWNASVIRIRNADGERTMPSNEARGNDCNLCHQSGVGMAGVLIEPQP